MSNKDSWVDDWKELINGGWIMLFIFGGTICALASGALIFSMITNDPVKIAMLSKILDTVIGFIAGAYTTMWNNQHFKTEKNGKETVSVASNPSDGGLKIKEMTLKTDETKITSEGK